MFDINNILPSLIRQDVDYIEHHFPEIPDEVPPVVAADPGWKRQWLKAKAQPQNPSLLSTEGWSPKRKRQLGEYLAMIGFFELELIVQGCTYAVTHYEMPTAWRTCLIKQAYQDMKHATGYLTYRTIGIEEEHWPQYLRAA